ncbi:MAG: TonB-dependent receptor plug domain-containing protein, partial [Caulobacterales bacterium]|nr:TonB-dependent receptor plug domain-containing protein [Caulobacterales bacterium]
MNKRWGCAVLAAMAAAPGGMADDRADPDQILVWGRGLELIGNAQAASQGVVGYADFETRPISRIGELVEVIPGLVATQHSGSGKANQYFLRGFNLDHGTDFSARVDGQPINLRTHGHGQGYLDLNFIIPEIVERVEFRKGPYYADVGDFSAAASADFITYDALDDAFIKASLGENGFGRVVSAGSAELLGGSMLLAGEGQVYDGPWELEEDLSKINLFGKYVRDVGGLRA